MAWTNIPNANLAAGAPIRSVDILALRDNVVALGNQESGAPTLVKSLNGQTGAITNTSVGSIGSYVYSFTNTDVSKGATTAGSNILSFSLSGTWRNMGYSDAPSGTPCIFVRVS